MRRLSTIAILCSTLVALLGCGADAKIVERDNIRSIPVLLRYIEGAEGDGSPGQAFILIRLGAASILVDSAMDSSVDPLRHAELLHAAMENMGFERMRVVWTTEGEYSIASCKVGSGRLFAREAETIHRVGALLETFREAGFTPVAEAGVLRYAGSTLQPERETERYGWAGVGHVPGRL